MSLTSKLRNSLGVEIWEEWILFDLDIIHHNNEKYFTGICLKGGLKVLVFYPDEKIKSKRLFSILQFSTTAVLSSTSFYYETLKAT